MGGFGTWRHVAIAGLAVAVSATTASAQWTIVDDKDGDTTVKIGFLAQPQAEFVETTDDASWSQNLFLRRVRVLLGGTLGKHWSFFFETDSPNIGKAGTAGAKEAGDVYVQDVFVTYSHGDAFKMDVGMLLLGLSHNHLESAAALLPVDYGPYTFTESGPTGERVGRDYGLQARGYPFARRLEYRVGLFQGVRGPDSRNPLRVVARAVWHPLGSDTGYFYTGTSQGTRRALAIGATIDRQKAYHVHSVDGFYEQPLGGGGRGLTLQAGWTHFDGAQAIRPLAEQNTWLVEAGYHFGAPRLTPFVQWAARDFTDATTPGHHTLQVGLAWWLKGHQRNLKISAGRERIEGRPARAQVLAQLQVFYY